MGAITQVHKYKSTRSQKKYAWAQTAHHRVNHNVLTQHPDVIVRQTLNLRRVHEVARPVRCRHAVERDQRLYRRESTLQNRWHDDVQVINHTTHKHTP